MKQHRRTINVLYLLVTIIIIGTIGYSYMLDITFMNAMYMTVITMSTVGFQEVAPMTVPAQIFTIVLIFFSLGTVGYTGSHLVAYVFGGELKEARREQKMMDKLDKLNNHIIVCGAGETGQHIIQSLHKENADFVVIEFEKEKLDAVK